MAKMKKINFKSKKTWKNILLIGLACITLIGAIVGLSALFRKAEETTKTINPSYSVGALDHSTGKYVETKSAIYTKEGFECQGLTTSLDFDAVVKYQLFFYSEYDEFIHTTGLLDGVFYSTSVPIYAKYARIVIIPNEDENITWLEKNKYSKQLNIEIDKEQNFKSFGENLFKFDESIGNTGTLSETDGVTIVENQYNCVSAQISCSGKRNSLFINAEELDELSSTGLYLYNLDGTFNSFIRIGVSADKSYSVSTGKYHYSYKISSDIGSIRLRSNIYNIPEIYLY